MKIIITKGFGRVGIVCFLVFSIVEIIIFLWKKIILIYIRIFINFIGIEDRLGDIVMIFDIGFEFVEINENLFVDNLL